MLASQCRRPDGDDQRRARRIAKSNLFRGRVIDGGDETTDFIAHGLCRDASRGSFEVYVTGTSDACAERFVAGGECVGHGSVKKDEC